MNFQNFDRFRENKKLSLEFFQMLLTFTISFSPRISAQQISNSLLTQGMSSPQNKAPTFFGPQKMSLRNTTPWTNFYSLTVLLNRSVDSINSFRTLLQYYTERFLSGSYELKEKHVLDDSNSFRTLLQYYTERFLSGSYELKEKHVLDDSKCWSENFQKITTNIRDEMQFL